MQQNKREAYLARVVCGTSSPHKLVSRVFVNAGSLDNAIDAKRRYETNRGDDQNFYDFSHCRLLTF